MSSCLFYLMNVKTAKPIKATIFKTTPITLGKFYGWSKLPNFAIIVIISFTNIIKGSDRLCKVVELSMQCCGKFLSDSFETY